MIRIIFSSAASEQPFLYIQNYTSSSLYTQFFSCSNLSPSKHRHELKRALTFNKQGSVGGDGIKGDIGLSCPVIAGNAVIVGGVAYLQVVNGKYASCVLFILNHRNVRINGNPLLIARDLGVVPEPVNGGGGYSRCQAKKLGSSGSVVDHIKGVG